MHRRLRREPLSRRAGVGMALSLPETAPAAVCLFRFLGHPFLGRALLTPEKLGKPHALAERHDKNCALPLSVRRKQLHRLIVVKRQTACPQVLRVRSGLRAVQGTAQPEGVSGFCATTSIVAPVCVATCSGCAASISSCVGAGIAGARHRDHHRDPHGLGVGVHSRARCWASAISSGVISAAMASSSSA